MEGPAEVEDAAIEATSTTVESYADLRRLVEEHPYAVYFSGAAPRTDLFEEEVRRAHVAIGTRVVECPERDAIQLVVDSPEKATLHDSKPLYRRAKLSCAPPGFDTYLAAYILRSERSQYPPPWDLVNGYLEVQPPTTPEQMAAALYLLREPLETRLKKESQEARAYRDRASAGSDPFGDGEPWDQDRPVAASGVQQRAGDRHRPHGKAHL